MDDRAAAGVEHGGQQGAGEGEGAGDVDGHDPLPERVVRLMQRDHAVHDPGDVGEPVDLRAGGLDDPLQVLGAGDVRGYGDHGTLGGGRGEGGEPLGGEVHRDDAPALGDDPLGGGAADPGGGAGDDDGATGEAVTGGGLRGGGLGQLAAVHGADHVLDHGGGEAALAHLGEGRERQVADAVEHGGGVGAGLAPLLALAQALEQAGDDGRTLGVGEPAADGVLGGERGVGGGRGGGGAGHGVLADGSGPRSAAAPPL